MENVYALYHRHINPQAYEKELPDCCSKILSRKLGIVYQDF